MILSIRFYHVINGKQWAAIRGAEKRGREALARVTDLRLLEEQFDYLSGLRRLQENGDWNSSMWQRHAEIIFQRDVAGWQPTTEVRSDGVMVQHGAAGRRE